MACSILSPIPSSFPTPFVPLVSIISEKLIIPSSPTPPAQRWHKLSLLDQAYSNHYIPFALYYTKQQLDIASNDDPTQISLLLQESLSKTLVSYYPYAGRLKDNTIVDCNDAGAEFIQVQINLPVSEALKGHNKFIEEMIFPQGLPWSDCTNRGLVVAQLSYFSCGGIAVSMCISHKVGDGHSGCNLFCDWANITRQPNGLKPSLHYVQESVFPSPPCGTPFLSPVHTSKKDNCIQRRYNFSVQKLDELKSLVASKSIVKNPTRNDVVSALLFKCVAAAVKANSGNSFQPWYMTQLCDLREQIGLPPNSIGNILTASFISMVTEEEMTLSNIVAEMRKGKQQICDRDNIKDNALLKGFLNVVLEEKTSSKGQDNACHFSSFVKFPIHEIDFGWGKPAKVSIANCRHNRLIFLMGNQSGGVDAFVSLSEQDMYVFDHDKELLQFATPIPKL